MLIIYSFLKLKQKSAVPERCVIIWIIPLCCTSSSYYYVSINFLLPAWKSLNVVVMSKEFAIGLFPCLWGSVLWNGQFWAKLSNNMQQILFWFTKWLPILDYKVSYQHYYGSTVLPLHFLQHDGNKALCQPLLCSSFNWRTNVCPWHIFAVTQSV